MYIPVIVLLAMFRSALSGLRKNLKCSELEHFLSFLNPQILYFALVLDFERVTRHDTTMPSHCSFFFKNFTDLLTIINRITKRSENFKNHKQGAIHGWNTVLPSASSSRAASVQAVALLRPPSVAIGNHTRC
jgi:hypothetical protein